jgi:hypothetical protein
LTAFLLEGDNSAVIGPETTWATGMEPDMSIEPATRSEVAALDRKLDAIQALLERLKFVNDLETSSRRFERTRRTMTVDFGFIFAAFMVTFFVAYKLFLT